MWTGPEAVFCLSNGKGLKFVMSSMHSGRLQARLGYFTNICVRSAGFPSIIILLIKIDQSGGGGGGGGRRGVWVSGRGFLI